MTNTTNYIREAISKICFDGYDTGLPALPDATYNALLENMEILLTNPIFLHQYTWETLSPEQPVSRPTFDASDRSDCGEKIGIKMYEGEEKDSSEGTVFEGFWTVITVDGYVMVKGRSTVDKKGALVEVCRKVEDLVRMWKA